MSDDMLALLFVAHLTFKRCRLRCAYLVSASFCLPMAENNMKSEEAPKQEGGVVAKEELATPKKEGAGNESLSVLEKIIQQLGKDAPIRERFDSYINAINDLEGGPMQFLTRVLPNKESKAAFAEWLLQEFPIHDNKEVWSEKADALPRITKTDFLLHVSQLGFDRDCSTKPPPFKKISRDLIAEYASSGFVTRGDALELDPTLHTTEGSPYFRVGYVKGMARSCTLLALLFGHYKGGIDLKTWPEHQTVIDITCRIEEVFCLK